jgi:hypothetical protein
MQTIEVTVYELAASIEEQAPYFVEKGEFALLHRARELTRAKSEWDNLRKTSDINDLESPERAEAAAAVDAFAIQYSSFVGKRTDEASKQGLTC